MAILTVGVVAGALYYLLGREQPPHVPTFNFAELTGSAFLPMPKNAFIAPRVRELEVPPFDDATSVWGATGRDHRGHIWIGASASSDGKSAHLLEYSPDDEQWRDHGDVVTQVRAAGLYHTGSGQIKIHSKIVPASDGWLYFASTDEEGERAVPPVPPRWGSHLWRIHPERHTWEHLFAAPEGLVAVSGVGRYVYALGYWGHVLYQYDTTTHMTSRAVVGSVAGHVSRNFLADVRGHAYVPRVSAQADGTVAVHLVEFDERLKELAATPLTHYLGNETPGSNHGIVGLAYLPDGRMVLSTHIGYLYLIDPGEPAARITGLGWLHPEGTAYAPSLFAYGGNQWIAGVVQRPRGFDWVVYDLRSRLSSAFPLDTKGLKNVLLYGSVTRDDAGRAYLVGWASKAGGGQRPLVVQVDPGR